MTRFTAADRGGADVDLIVTLAVFVFLVVAGPVLARHLEIVTLAALALGLWTVHAACHAIPAVIARCRQIARTPRSAGRLALGRLR